MANLTTQMGFDPFRSMRELLRLEPFTEFYKEAGLERLSDFNPTFDVRETKEAIVLTADMPGVAEKDLEITLTENRLTIAGKREAEKEEKGETYYRAERAWGRFARSFVLPQAIDLEHVVAELKNGVLTVRVPRTPEVQPKRIAIKPNVNVKA